MPKTIASEPAIKPNSKIPVSPNTEMIENVFESDECSFGILSARNMPKNSKHNAETNHKILNFETFDFCTSPFGWNVIENGINPNTREIM